MANIFEDFQEKKNHIIALTNKASEYALISKERAKEIIEKIESDVLTIAVIGQMKCGKSTFLNAFVFEDNVLPAATTPMTASLSLITYGEQKKVIANFYTKDEWEEQKLTASRDLSEVEGNELECAKIKAAKELVEKSKKLGQELYSLLGKNQEDSFDNLIEYVGADGKYISITKGVKIFYPKEYLKGVEIVDTPGLNDPITSREERTKNFLQKADVVLMTLYAGQPFTATDKTILFENVRKCGIEKVLVGVNKYDVPYENGENEEKIKQYVKEEIEKACKEFRDDSIAEILKDVEPVLFSAQMALISKLPMSKVEQKTWNRYCDIFEISTQAQFLEKSHIKELSFQIMNLIENEKGKILFAKPQNEIVMAGKNKKTEIEKHFFDAQNELKVLSMPDEELDEKLENLCKADKKMNKKLEKLDGNLNELLSDERLPSKKRGLEDFISDACKKMNNVVDTWRLNESFEEVRNKLERKVSFVKRDLQRQNEDNLREIKRILRDEITNYFSDIEDIAERYIEDFDITEFLKDLKDKIFFEIDEKMDLCNFDENSFSKNGDFWNSMTNGWIFTRGANKDEIKSQITEIEKNFSAQGFVDFVLAKVEEFVCSIKKQTIDDILTPIKNSIEECKNDKSQKQEKIEQKTKLCNSLEIQKQELEKQIQAIQNML